MGAYDDLAMCIGFQWDDGRNRAAHEVSDPECEEVLFNDPLVAGADPGHSKKERRYYALGRTDAARPLLVALTIRGNLIRVISARDMTKKELRKYLS